MSRWYRFLYWSGFKPWEENTEADRTELRSLLDLVEKGRSPPYGSALDLGCGSGRWSIELASRGWNAIGVDVVPGAIRRAEKRAAENGSDARFFVCDVTDLRKADIGSGFDFVLDVECFNHLDDRQRAAVGREVNRVTNPGAAMLLLAWKPGNRGPLPPGADRNDILHAFAGWHIVSEHAYAVQMPYFLRDVSPVWYRLTRS